MNDGENMDKMSFEGQHESLPSILEKKKKKPTSPESHDTTKDEVLRTILEMAPWGDIHEELKIEKVIPMSKVEECIFKLNKEMEATTVKQKEENLKNMIVNDYVPKLLLKHN